VAILPKDTENSDINLSLYEDHVAYFYGKMSATLASLVSFFITTEFVFLVTTIAMLSIMLADIGNIRKHRELVDQSSNELEQWREHYKFLSTAFMLITGIWCFFCFLLTDNDFLHLLCIATSMGNIFNLISRNFGDERILTLQLIAVGAPIIMGVLSYGDYRSMILCSFFLPLLSSVKDVSSRLKGLFSDVQKDSDEREAFGVQLNEALESMSHGLLMFDENMRLRVINRTARRILVINDEIDCFGKKLSGIARSVDLQKPYVNRVRILEDALLKRLQQRTHSKIFQMSRDQFVELSIKLREAGGCVLVIEDVSQRIQYQNRINQLARYDDLTGLCNRSYFHQQVEGLLIRFEKNTDAVMIFFDLDDFKRINDMLGHEAGDYILNQVSKRIRNFMPKDTIIGRYGGDEFVVFVPINSLANKNLEFMASELIQSVTEPIEYNQQILRIGSSLGLAKYPQDAENVDRLLKLADLALYESKKAGKNTMTFFTPNLEDGLHERVQMEQDLIKAVQGNDLDLHFQPIVSMDTQTPTVFEALTRWNRNGVDNVSPALFVPLAEDLGLIREIGEWTLMEACRQCKTWPENSSVAVNVSAVQFQVGSIIEAVSKALNTTGIEPHRLEIEITETAVLNDMDHAVIVLETLSDMGVRISLDDFGTGYSSLSYLHKLPLDKLKIDKSFIDDILESDRSQTLLKGITAMGKALDLKLVVEGIESQAQFDLLAQNYDIDFVQGFYFSKALPASAAKEFAHRFNGSSHNRDNIVTQTIENNASQVA